MKLFHTSEVFCFLLFHQEQANGDAEEGNRTDSENSSCSEAEIPRGETHHLLDKDSLSVSEAVTGDEEESEYEDCQEEEEEEEDWQTCSEEDSNANEDAYDQNWKKSCTVDSEAQGMKTPQKRQTHNFSHLVSKQELLEILKQLHTGKKVKDQHLTVGLVRLIT